MVGWKVKNSYWTKISVTIVLEVSKKYQPVFITPTQIMLIQQVYVVCCNYCKTFDRGHETRQCQLVLCMQFNWIKPQGGILKRFKGCIIELQNCQVFKPNSNFSVWDLSTDCYLEVNYSKFHTNLNKEKWQTNANSKNLI